MLDIERFTRERQTYDEIWTKPVIIKFGAVFEMLSGGRTEPLYSLGVVADIRRGESFKGWALIREQVDEKTGEVLADLIGGQGDLLRSNILRMTDEVLSPAQIIEGLRQGFVYPGAETEDLSDIRQYLEKLSRKGQRLLPGRQK